MDHHRGGDHAVKLMPSAYQWPDTSAPKVPRSGHSGVETRGHATLQKVDHSRGCQCGIMTYKLSLLDQY